jgi:hypothetical protein
MEGILRDLQAASTHGPEALHTVVRRHERAIMAAGAAAVGLLEDNAALSLSNVYVL